MNYKKRKKKWQKEINEGKKDYEEKTGLEYDYYGEVSRRESMKAPKETKISFSKLIRVILFIIYIILYISLKFF